MFKIEAIVRPHVLEEVKNKLTEAGFSGMTVTEVRGFGRQKGHREMYRGTEYKVDFVPKLKIEVAVAEQDLDRVVELVTASARSGQIGDGKIFVTSLSQVVRVRTGETGKSAI